jgi:carbamoyltransferase
LVVDGKILAAAEEERFTRKKHDHRFPRLAVEYCLREAALSPDRIDHVTFYDKPFLKFGRLFAMYLGCAPRCLSPFTKAMRLWLRQKLHVPRGSGAG